jgi:hypothetical protein
MRTLINNNNSMTLARMTGHRLHYPHSSPGKGRFFLFATASLTPLRVPENLLAKTYRDFCPHGEIHPEPEADYPTPPSAQIKKSWNPLTCQYIYTEYTG